MTFTAIDLQQGSVPWRRWRHDGIGGSDAPTLMGENPWRSAGALFAEKCSPPRLQRQRAVPSRGTALEPYARDLYNRHTGSALHPQCLQSADRPWQRASLDGFCAASRRAVEIKCGDKVHSHTLATGVVPGYYVGQLQHSLAVTGFDAIDFWVWLPGKTPLLVTVPRDEDYIARLLVAEADFWAAVLAVRGDARA